MFSKDPTLAVYVVFALTKRGKRTIQFAGDLARLLGRDLVALIKPNKARDVLAKEAGLSTPDSTTLIQEAVVSLSGVDPGRCRVEEDSGSIPEGSIRVTSDSRNWDPDPREATFFSATETGLFARGRGPLYVTVGDRWTHPTAISEAVELAKTLGVEVMLYHSTWRVAGNDSLDPRDHVSENALKVLSSAVTIAEKAKVPVQIVLEHAATIADGVLRHAIENGASAIVMTKSARARRGSYVDQVVLHSPIPVFVVPLSNGGTNVDDLPPVSSGLPFFAKQSKVEAPKGIAYFVMVGVLLMYIFEVISKVSIGSYINSPVIEGDGWHNASDIFEAVMVIVTIYLANQPASQHYPHGWKNLEHIFGVFVGMSLGWMGFGILKSSSLSIMAVIAGTSQHKPLLMGAQYFPWAAGVMAVSVILSLIVSRIQINCGKKYGYPSIVADGEETLSDARIAGTALVGVLSEYLFDLPQIEYFLGVIVSVFILHASYKILISGLKGLLQHSIGDEKEQGVRQIVLTTRGVFEIVKLSTTISGSSADVDLHIVSKVMRSELLRAALANRVIDYCVANGFVSADCHVEFDGPFRPSEDQVERIAFAAIAHPTDPYLAIVAPSLSVATHIVGADDERYSSRRSFIDPKPKNLKAYLAEKHVRKLYVYGSVLPEDVKTAEEVGIPISAVSTYCLETLGA